MCPGQRTLDRDLGGLAIADLPHHQHVGIGPHHHRSPFANVSPAFGLIWILGDPLDWYSIRPRS